MFTLLYHLKNRYLSQRAQGIVEYALILAFVVVLSVALTNTGGLADSVKQIFTDTKGVLDDAHKATGKT